MGKGMRAGKKPKSGGGSRQKQLQQVQEMQRRMQQVQEELEEKEITTTAGGGVVSVTMNGRKEIVKLTLNKEIVDPDDIETLEDLIVAAVNEGIHQTEERANEEMSKITSGLGISAAV